MNRLAIILFFVCFGALAASVPVNVRYDFSDFTLNAQGVRRINITPINAPMVYTNIISGDRLSFTNNSSGALIVTNLVAPGSYEVDFVGRFQTLSFTNTFPETNAGVTLNAKDFISAPTNTPTGAVAYSMASADARFAPISGGPQVWTNDGALIKLSSDANVPPAVLVDTNSSKIEINAADASSSSFFYARTRDSGSGFQASTTDSINGNTFVSTHYTYTTGTNGVMAFAQYEGSSLFTLLDPAQDNGDAPYVFDTISPATHGAVLADFRLGRASKITFGTNGNITLAGTTNQIIFGGTNTAPVGSATTPTKWISVRVQGESTVYRLPLYQ